MIRVKQRGDLSKTIEYLGRVRKAVNRIDWNRYGQEGVTALAAATPVDTGLTANSWHYKIVKTKDSISITFYNSNIQNGIPIALILQYGHGTRNGGWVQGRDYINPAIQPIFDKLANDAWREVTKR